MKMKRIQMKMKYIKNPTKEQKEQWQETLKAKEKQARESIDLIARNFRERPEVIMEYLQFSENFYQYSPRNTMLIYAQNEFASFVQSFKAWKDAGYPVKKGETGLNIFVPVKTTLLQISKDKYVQLRDATKEQKQAYSEGKILGITKLSFKIGTVFDISQTTYPVEKYPEFLNKGYDSKLHHSIADALKDYSEKYMDCPVSFEDMKSITLNGYYIPNSHEIKLNSLLKDTHYFSTLCHEMGHAIARHKIDNKSEAQKEYEGDCFSILLHKHWGLEIPENVQRHFSTHFRKFENEIKTRQKNDLMIDRSINQEIESSFSFIFSKYAEEIEHIDTYLDNQIPEFQKNKWILQESENMQKEEQQLSCPKQDINTLHYFQKYSSHYPENGLNQGFEISK